MHAQIFGHTQAAGFDVGFDFDKMRRVGGTKDIDLDVRIIVASNERLSEAAKKGQFREDLYHRFNEFSIDLPPLKNRQEDIKLFAEFF